MAEQKETIVILIPGFAESEADMNCLPMQQSFILALHKTFPALNIRIIALEYPHHKTAYLWHGIPVKPLGGRNRGGLQRILLRRHAYRELEKMNQKEKISGVLSFWTGLTGECCTRFGRKHNIPHFSWIMGQDARPGNKYVKRNQYRPDELIALSASLQQRYERSYGVRPQQVIVPGISMMPVNDTSAHPYRVIGAGSLIPLKRFDLFIEVIAEARKKIPVLEAVIYGEGPLRSTLQEQIERLGLKEVILLGGKIPHPELLQQMRQSRVLLHPSSFEGFSGVCLEARAAGIPVISYCQPMQDELPGWYTAPDKTAMIKMLVTEMLMPAEMIPFEWPSMNDTAQELIRLFGIPHKAANVSASFSAV